MNNKIYNTVILLFISSLGLMAQTQKKFQKTFSVDKTTQLRFETRNIDVTFKIWNKDQVKVDFTIDFKNYSEAEVKKISNEIIVSTREEASMGDMNYLLIQNSSPTTIGRRSYTIKSGEIRVENFFESNSEPNKYKSVAMINKEIEATNNGIQDLDGFVVFENEKVALKDLESSTHKDIQNIRSSYVIYVPTYMMIDMMADNANIIFDGTFTNSIRGSFKESILEAATLSNDKNMFSFMNGTIKIKKISGGQFICKNVTNSLIGELENASLETEFSKIDIGEVKKNVAFRDFKSKFFFYNLAANFETINMLCEYSDIKMYADKDQKYYMEAYGNNAVLNDGGTKIIVQPSRDGKKSKMFTRGKDDEETRKNTFKLDIVHGFVTLFYR
ncbi:hypothetical protein KORDIASMS9_03326 [Kordia sp. SMS9]|uniref:hypothetical protein n=1 Tax=Kordia sp. SMS9 TaxID=2282170 RepID=UPI000E0DB375|nr:hypothetical protein [Kordia sp. SMS9]AXG71071.1 hypothetical protein KORDIASMS9_03326 [Kordia sp. SMS9]